MNNLSPEESKILDGSIVNSKLYIEMDDIKVTNKTTAFGITEKLTCTKDKTSIILWSSKKEDYAYIFLYFPPEIFSKLDAGFMFYRIKREKLLTIKLAGIIMKMHNLEITEASLLEMFQPNN